jgi:hypothetical protein
LRVSIRDSGGGIAEKSEPVLTFLRPNGLYWREKRGFYPLLNRWLKARGRFELRAKSVRDSLSFLLPINGQYSDPWLKWIFPAGFKF